MIVFKRIKWRNFLSTGNYDIEIPLNKSKTTLLCGKNGVGKSILSDALCFVLFGKPFRDGIKKPQLINSVTGRGLVVEIEFTRGQQEFHIVRGMKPNVFEIYQNGELVDQSSRAKDYQTWLEENVLKTNFKTFCQIVIIGSANFTPFMKLPASHRRTIIEDLLDISIFSTMNDLIKEKNSRAREEINRVESSIARLEEIVETKKRHRDELAKISHTAISEKERALKKQREDLHHLRESLRNFSVDNSAQKKLESLRSKRYQFESAITKLEGSRRALEKRKQHFEELDVCPSCEQKMNEEQRNAKLVELDESLESNTKKQIRVRHEIEKIDEQIKTYERVEEEHRTFREKRIQIEHSISIGETNERDLEESLEELKRLEGERQDDDGLEGDEKVLMSEKKKLRKLEYVRGLYQHALSMLKDSGVKADIISEYVPLINKLVNEYLDKLEFFCQFEIDEEFKEHIRQHHCKDFSYSSFSQGQKMRVDLALLFTWREVARLRNSSSFNILILDEVMDSSLDSEGTEEFLGLLFTLAQHNNVFIISHKTQQIVDKFDDVLYFDRQQNFTRITGET